MVLSTEKFGLLFTLLIAMVSAIRINVDDAGLRERESISNNYYDRPEYHYRYSVSDPGSGDIKGAWEKRSGSTVWGGYWLREADGSWRTVQYNADHTGFHAVVQRRPSAQQHVTLVEPANTQDVLSPPIPDANRHQTLDQNRLFVNDDWPSYYEITRVKRKQHKKQETEVNKANNNNNKKMTTTTMSTRCCSNNSNTREIERKTPLKTRSGSVKTHHMTKNALDRDAAIISGVGASLPLSGVTGSPQVSYSGWKPIPGKVRRPPRKVLPTTEKKYSTRKFIWYGNVPTFQRQSHITWSADPVNQSPTGVMTVGSEHDHARANVFWNNRL